MLRARRKPSLSIGLPLAERALNFALRIARRGGVALVVQVLALAKAQFQLHAPVLEVYL